MKIKFVGGPYDGHTQRVPDVDLLAETVALPVNRNIFRMLNGLPALAGDRTTSIAIYELDRGSVNEECRAAYYFLGATVPQVPYGQ